MKIRTIDATITGFRLDDGKLTVYFATGDRSYRTLAHPALAHRNESEERSPIALLVNEETTLRIAETEDGWKAIRPYPTETRIKAYEEAKKARENLISEATEAEMALASY